MSVCMGNREWEPDPGEVDCIGIISLVQYTMDNCTYYVTQCRNNQWLNYDAADCGVPLVNRNVKLNYTSTLDGSVLVLAC